MHYSFIFPNECHNAYNVYFYIRRANTRQGLPAIAIAVRLTPVFVCSN